MLIDNVLAMSSGGDLGGTGGNPVSLLFPMVIVFGIFYFLIIRPQSKERQKVQSMLDSLKAGDKVVTTGGILGTIHSISENIVELKVGEKLKISVLRSAIRGFQDEPTESPTS